MIGSIPASAADAAKSAGFFSEVERVFRAFPAETTLFGASLIGVRPASCVHSDSINYCVQVIICAFASTASAVALAVP